MKWTKEQDFLAFFLYKKGGSVNSQIGVRICKIMNIGESTLKMRIGNFKHLNGENGLSHPAKMSKETFEKYKNLSLEELEKIASKILSDHTSH